MSGAVAFPIVSVQISLFKAESEQAAWSVQTASAAQPVRWTTPADRTLRPGTASAKWASPETTVTPVLQDSTDSTVRVRHSLLSVVHLFMVKLHLNEEIITLTIPANPDYLS